MKNSRRNMEIVMAFVDEIKDGTSIGVTGVNYMKGSKNLQPVRTSSCKPFVKMKAQLMNLELKIVLLNEFGTKIDSSG